MAADDSLLDGDNLRRCRGHLGAGGFLRMRLILLIDNYYYYHHLIIIVLALALALALALDRDGGA